jgi:hypothetical protein
MLYKEFVEKNTSNLLTPRDTQLDEWLTNFGLEYALDQTDFHADRLAPIIRTDKEQGLFPILPKGSTNRDIFQEFAAGAESKKNYVEFSRDTYVVKYYNAGFNIESLHYIQASERNGKPIMDQKEASVKSLYNGQLILRERKWASTFFNNTTWGTNVSGVIGIPGGANQFVRFDQANSNPITTLRTYIELLGKSSGIKPNKIIMTKDVWLNLVDHPAVLARLSDNTLRIATKESILALLMDVKEIVVLDALYNTSSGVGSAASLNYFATNSILITYVDPSPSLYTATSMVTMEWEGNEANPMKSIVDLTPLEVNTRTLSYEMVDSFGHKVVASDLGLFMSNVVS